MKQELKIISIILVIILLLFLLFFMKNVKKQEKPIEDEEIEDVAKEYEILENNNMKVKMRAIVVRVYEGGLMVVNAENTEELTYVKFTEEGNIGYIQGQEILIYFDGMVMTSYPGQLGNVGKIEIVKEKSDISIPEHILRSCYSSRDKVKVAVSELTTNGIHLMITDTNELMYNYSHSYTINKKVKNEDYTGVGYKVGEDTENSTSGYTRNRSSLYMGRSR